MSSSAKVYLITGANRGIGFALVNEIASKQPNAVIIATARDPSQAYDLKELAVNSKCKIEIVTYVAADVEGNRALAKFKDIGDKYGHVDMIIANAGITNYIGAVAETPAEAMGEHFEVNTISVLVLFQAFFSLLKASPSPKFIPITSGGGSMTAYIDMPPEFTAYCASKVALNYISRRIHFENAWLTCFPLAPGVVDTDMSKASFKRDKTGTLAVMKAFEQTPEVAAGLLASIIESSTRETHGGEFINVDGTKIPW